MRRETSDLATPAWPHLPVSVHPRHPCWGCPVDHDRSVDRNEQATQIGSNHLRGRDQTRSRGITGVGGGDGTAHLDAARPRGGAPPPTPSIRLTGGDRAACNRLDRGRWARGSGQPRPSLAWGSERERVRVGEGGRKGVISAGSGALGKVKRGTFPPSLSLTHTLERGV